jgi:hypothetical protein
LEAVPVPGKPVLPKPPDPKEVATAAALKLAASRTLAGGQGKDAAKKAMNQTGASLLTNPTTNANHVLKNLPDDDDDNSQQPKMMKKKMKK